MIPRTFDAHITRCRRAFRRIAVCAALAIAAAGCDRAATPRVADGVVSLSPAATGLIVAMGAADRLVGVSTFDADPRVAALPRVGDYENVDWERIRALAPRHLLTQVARDRLPAGFLEQARSIDCSIRSIHIDRLDDIRRSFEQIGEELGDAAAAQHAWATLRAKLDDIASAASTRPAVRTLVAISDDAASVVGGDNFVDELLTIAGGTNALGPTRRGYLTIDREQLIAADPDAIVFLLPGATAEQLARARAAVASLPPRARAVVFVTAADVLQPNANLATTAAAISAGLRGDGDAAERAGR